MFSVIRVVRENAMFVDCNGKPCKSHNDIVVTALHEQRTRANERARVSYARTPVDFRALGALLVYSA
jgi:hypothetical protein